MCTLIPSTRIPKRGIHYITHYITLYNLTYFLSSLFYGIFTFSCVNRKQVLVCYSPVAYLPLSFSVVLYIYQSSTFKTPLLFYVEAAHLLTLSLSKKQYISSSVLVQADHNNLPLISHQIHPHNPQRPLAKGNAYM